MAYFLFLDESGHDHKESPYEVLAGVSVRDCDLWNLINALHDAELRHFGRRYSAGNSELKGTKILKRKTFQHAGLNVQIEANERTRLAKEALDNGATATIHHLKALGQAKLDYAAEVFEICGRFRCQAFASIVETNAVNSASGGLRKDYGYLFERFYYYLQDRPHDELGIIVFDELEKTQSHLLIDQAHKYFRETATGRTRASRIIPEPFFVHSDLTTGIQLADLVAYVISWGVRLPAMSKPARPELRGFAEQVLSLRYRTVRERNGMENFAIWSFQHITDLRTRQERDEE